MKYFALTLLALSLPATALAGDFRFVYSPQYLATSDGVKDLHRELEYAVNRYCRNQFITLNVVGQKECSRALMEQTIERIGNAKLAAYQEARGDRSS